MRQFFFLQLTGDKNGFGTTNLCDQDVDHLENKIQETFEDRFTAKKICNDKATYCEPCIHFSQTNKGWFTVVGDENQLFNGGHKHTDESTPLPVSGSQQPLVACDSL